MKSKISYIDLDEVKKWDTKKECMDRLKKHRRKMTRLVNRQSDWDYGEIYELLEKKLRNILEYAKTDSVTYESEWRPQWIARAISLANHLTHNRKYPTYINTNNASRFKETRSWNFHANEERKKSLEGVQSEVLREELLKVDVDRLTAEEFYDLKAKHLFFKIMTNYIEYWWD